jgi:hypothetical protein
VTEDVAVAKVGGAQRHCTLRIAVTPDIQIPNSVLPTANTVFSPFSFIIPSSEFWCRGLTHDYLYFG